MTASWNGRDNRRHLLLQWWPQISIILAVLDWQKSRHTEPQLGQ